MKSTLMKSTLMIVALFLFLPLACASRHPGGEEERGWQEEPVVESEVDHGAIRTILTVQSSAGGTNQQEALQIKFTVENQSAQPRSFQFSSSQQVDFELRDEGGRMQWQWSKGRFFATVILEKQLGEEPWVFREEIPLREIHPPLLSDGRYSLTAILTGRPRLEHRISFELP